MNMSDRIFGVLVVCRTLHSKSLKVDGNACQNVMLMQNVRAITYLGLWFTRSCLNR